MSVRQWPQVQKCCLGRDAPPSGAFTDAERHSALDAVFRFATRDEFAEERDVAELAFWADRLDGLTEDEVKDVVGLEQSEAAFLEWLTFDFHFPAGRTIVDLFLDRHGERLRFAERRTAQMRYFSVSAGAVTRREVDPYHLWYAAGGLYLIAYCHRRRDVRLFAVERIRSLTVTDHAYQLPLGFDIEQYVQDALVVMRGRQIEVELLFDRRTAAWARDRIWHSSQEATPLRDGRLRMKLRVADTAELMSWILSFGRGVRVVSPAELRTKIRREALAVARQ